MVTESSNVTFSPPVARPADVSSAPVFRRFVGPEGLAAIRDDWRAIQERLSPVRPFHLYDWYTNYLDTLEPDPASVDFFVAYQGGSPMAVFPLRRTTWRVGGLPLRCLETSWHSHSTLGDCVWMNDAVAGDIVPQFLDYLRSQRDVPWDVLFVRRAMADSRLIERLRLRRGFLVMLRPAEGCNCLVTSDYEAMIGSLTKNARGNLRKAHGKLAKMPDPRFYTVTAPGEIERAFTEFVDLEAAGWKGHTGHGMAIKVKPRLDKFYRRLMRDADSGWKCEIHLLKAGNLCLAGGFSILVGDTCYFLKTAYNEDYRHMSPGHLLLDFMARRQSEAGEYKYINLITSREWHRFWNPTVQKTCDAYVFAPSPRGLAGAALLRARLACGRVKRAVGSLLTRKGSQG